MRLVLGLDQGTSSTCCVAFDERLRIRGTGAVPVGCAFPAADRVEQDADELAASAGAAVLAALDAAGGGARDVVAMGLAAQTETLVAWDRETHAPLHPAIGWQCRRAADACGALHAAGHAPLVRRRTGLPLEPGFPATKMRWLLDHVPAVARAAARGTLALGDVAAWLAFRLTRGATYATDPGMAARTMLCRLDELAWDRELAELVGVPLATLPAIADSDAPFGVAHVDGAGGAIPIRGVLGDQQASLLGQRCWTAGDAKATLGTGAFLWVHAGAQPPTAPPGIVATCAWRIGNRPAFALEGMVPAAGSAIAWLVELGVLDDVADLATVLERDDGAGGEPPTAVLALHGLGSPSMDGRARGALLGLTRATTAADVARGAVDGIVHQLADAADAMRAAVPLTGIGLDGGLSRSDAVVRRVAQLLGTPVRRAAHPESTALGAAMAAGLGAGLWPSLEAVGELVVAAPPVPPSLPAADRAAARARWARAVALTRAFAAGEP